MLPLQPSQPLMITIVFLKIIKLLSEFNKISGFTNKLQKSTTLLCTRNKIWDTIDNSLKNIKGNIIKQKSNITEDLHPTNYKMRLEEIEDLYKGRGIECLWGIELNIIKMSIFSELFSRFNASL